MQIQYTEKSVAFCLLWKTAKRNMQREKVKKCDSLF